MSNAPQKKLKLLEYHFFRFLIQKTKNVQLPGLGGATLHDVALFFIKEIKNTGLLERADLVTFNFLMAIPSAFLFLFSIIPLFHIGNIEKTILEALEQLSSDNKMMQNIKFIINDFLGKSHTNIFSISVLLTLYFSSNGTLSLIKSFDTHSVVFQKRSPLLLRWVALKLTIMMMIALILTVGFLIIQNQDFDKFLMVTFHSIIAIKILSYMTLLFLIFITITWTYRYGPSLKYRFSFLSAGAIFSTIATVLLMLLFYYLSTIILYYNKIYGSIGSIIAFMVWLRYNTIIILIGYKVNLSMLLGKLSYINVDKEKTPAHI